MLHEPDHPGGEEQNYSSSLGLVHLMAKIIPKCTPFLHVNGKKKKVGIRLPDWQAKELGGCFQQNSFFREHLNTNYSGNCPKGI